MLADLDTNQNLEQSAAIPLWVGMSDGAAVMLGAAAVRVVGVPGIPTQRYSSANIPVQSDPMVGFHLMRSSFEKRPNMPTTSSQVSEPSA